jgi:hypothetical protein
MANAAKYLKSLGALGIALLVLVVIFAVAILMGSEFKEQVCEQETGGTNYVGGRCYSASNASLLSEGDSFNATRDLVEQIVSVVGWVGLIVIAAIGGILIMMAKSFWNSKEGM